MMIAAKRAEAAADDPLLIVLPTFLQLIWLALVHSPFYSIKFLSCQNHTGFVFSVYFSQIPIRVSPLTLKGMEVSEAQQT